MINELEHPSHIRRRFTLGTDNGRRVRRRSLLVGLAERNPILIHLFLYEPEQYKL
jgi:hypothetical protein